MLDRLNVYINKKVDKFGDNLKLERNVFIGSNCKIGEKCELVNCYLANDCSIGNNVKLSNCILLSNVTVGNDCVVNASIIGSNCKIGNKCNIIENTVFANDCHIKNNSCMKVRGVFYKTPSTNQVKMFCFIFSKIICCLIVLLRGYRAKNDKII